MNSGYNLLGAPRAPAATGLDIAGSAGHECGERLDVGGAGMPHPGWYSNRSSTCTVWRSVRATLTMSQPMAMASRAFSGMPACPDR